jgi:hypothetical protein
MTYQLTNLNVASLDFDDIKSSLISFLEQQSDLKDLDFRNEASSVNLLLNILSTVTAYNGVYAQFGFVNSFATTANVMESILGIAANSSVLVAPLQSARVQRTVTTAGVTLEDYTTFKARGTNGADVFFFNTEQVLPNTSKSITLYSGTEVVSFTNYDYDTQSCILPFNVDPSTINMYETQIGSNQVIKWTRVDKSSTTVAGNNTHFTVMNAPQGYLVTNNFASSREVLTNSNILVQAILSNGNVGNSATITPRSDVTFGTFALPSNGYNQISVAEARAKLLFKATGQERCVTINDYKNAILSSGISGTSDETLISVGNTSYPGEVKVYVSGLTSENISKLLAYISGLTPAGITVVYQQ